MDPLTHIVIGRAVVAAARDESRNRIMGAAAILGALSPDVDSALVFAGWDRYVRAHQFGTHSLLGALTMAGLAAIVVDRSSQAIRRRPRVAQAFRPAYRGGSSPEGLRYRPVFLAAAAGAVSHVLLDLLSGARIAIAWPLFNRRVSVPLVAMADPWLIAICLAWLAMLWPARIPLRRASRIAVATAAIFVCAKAALLGVAIDRSGVSPHEPSAFEARWGSLTTWYVFERLTDRVRASTIAANGDEPLVSFAHPLTAESSLVAASRALDNVRNFLAVHEFTFAEETRHGDATASVVWSDIRYCWPAPAGGLWHIATNCGVGVGAVFEANGRAITQEIRIGSFVQRRTVSQPRAATRRDGSG
jgi:membrane-bound metal-dependent hydrolase YbcI (DUF457 family)